MDTQNNLPDISDKIQIVNVEVLYNILLDMQVQINDLENRIVEMENATKS